MSPSSSNTRTSCGALIRGFLLSGLLLLTPAHADPLTPPAESESVFQPLRTLRQQLDQGDPATLAQQFEELLARHADELVPAGEGGVISVRAFLDALPPQGLARIRTEYQRLFDRPARQALESARQDPHWLPLYAAARRYPLSSTASLAYAEAGDRAANSGDAPAALALYDLAQQAGGVLGPGQQARMADARRVVNGSPTDAYRGPIAFDALWYGRLEGVGLPHHHPVASDGVIYLAGPKHLLALKETGAPLWRWNAPDAWARMLPAEGKGHGTPYAPALLAGPAGAQILVACQPRPTGRNFTLRAFRATDGKPLWDLDENPAYEHLSFASAPALSGRFLYTVAAEFTENGANLVLIATDLLDGQLLFKTPIGTRPDLRPPDAATPDGFWNQTEPAVAGDALYISPNVGAVCALGRFDGKLRWIRPYGVARQGFPNEPNALLRWRTTPILVHDTLIVAPQDTDRTYGLNRRTGLITWTAPASPATTLVGQGDSVAILAGPFVQALDASTGKVQWKWEPPPATRITGPSAIVQGTVYIPLSTFRIQTLSAETGQPVSNAPKPPNFRQLLATEQGRKALEDAGITRTLGQPAP